MIFGASKIHANLKHWSKKRSFFFFLFSFFYWQHANVLLNLLFNICLSIGLYNWFIYQKQFWFVFRGFLPSLGHFACFFASEFRMITSIFCCRVVIGQICIISLCFELNSVKSWNAMKENLKTSILVSISLVNSRKYLHIP